MPQTSRSKYIVAIAQDPALLRSIAFALEAHGHRVKQFRSWAAARGATEAATCVILDGCLERSERDACLGALNGTGLVLLAEADTELPSRPAMVVLEKPLSGSDLVGAVLSLRIYP